MSLSLSPTFPWGIPLAALELLDVVEAGLAVDEAELAADDVELAADDVELEPPPQPATASATATNTAAASRLWVELAAVM